MPKKTVPIILMIVGGAFVLGAGLAWFDNLTAAQPVGLGKWIFDVLGLIVGAAAGIKGWLDFNKKEPASQVIKNTAFDSGQLATGDKGRNIQTQNSSQYTEQHIQNYYEASKADTPAREIKVSDDGIGSVIQNAGEGVGLDVTHNGKGSAERITVEGKGIGEIITNTGPGIGKRVSKTGEGSTSENKAIVNTPVQMAVGLIASTILTTCHKCGRSFTAQKVVQGFVGESVPKAKVNCPHCQEPNWV